MERLKQMKQRVPLRLQIDNGILTRIRDLEFLNAYDILKKASKSFVI